MNGPTKYAFIISTTPEYFQKLTDNNFDSFQKKNGLVMYFSDSVRLACMRLWVPFPVVPQNKNKTKNYQQNVTISNK